MAKQAAWCAVVLFGLGCATSETSGRAAGGSTALGGAGRTVDASTGGVTVTAGGAGPTNSAGIADAGATNVAGSSVAGLGGTGEMEPPAEPGDASFHDVVPSASTLGLYDMLKVTFGSSLPFTNPFDQDDIEAALVAIAADGSSVVMPAFFKSGSSGSATWEAHFTPQKLGHYKLRAQITRAGNSVKSDQFTLEVAPSALDGFLHLSPTSAYDLVFDSGKRFRGVGENYGWETDKYKFADMLPRLRQNNVTFIRTWEGPGRYLLQQGQPLSHFDETVASKLDQVMQLARDNGIYVMSTLEPAIYYLTTPNGGDVTVQWSANAFSTAQGGPCAKTADFFTNPEAKRHYKNKLRYAVARWGADPHLAVWEFWNEYDHLVEQLQVPTADIAAWHQEMGQYLRKIDPYGRIITTSLSHNDYADLWSLPEMQFSQRHLYGSTESLAGTIATYESKYQKPFVSGEFSLDWKWPQMHPASEYGRELHFGLWRGMFAPTPILPMTWWWDFHADNNQYFHFAHASTFAQKTTEGAGPLEPQAVSASNGIEVLALKSPSGRFVWVHNKTAGNLSGSVTLTDLPSVAFTVRALDTWRGGWSEPTTLKPSDGSAQLVLPSLAGDADLAYWLAAP
ncbi:MAG TPA: cellulase family glycosylhydrolase [Polyangiaceae bacterium]|nr:cellulase family glycosylhydrolase [Polyangiaceae bacterium]